MSQAPRPKEAALLVPQLLVLRGPLRLCSGGSYFTQSEYRCPGSTLSIGSSLACSCLPVADSQMASACLWPASASLPADASSPACSPAAAASLSVSGCSSVSSPEAVTASLVSSPSPAAGALSPGPSQVSALVPSVPLASALSHRYLFLQLLPRCFSGPVQLMFSCTVPPLFSSSLSPLWYLSGSCSVCGFPNCLWPSSGLFRVPNPAQCLVMRSCLPTLCFTVKCLD